jgi:hypothetical protein
MRRDEVQAYIIHYSIMHQQQDLEIWAEARLSPEMADHDEWGIRLRQLLL